MAQNAQGQPFDVLAARNGKSYPIDCKVCEHDKFPLSRIEENQAGAMTLWEETGNGDGWFALKLSNGAIFMIPWYQLRDCEKTTLNADEIAAKGMPLAAWVNRCL